MANANFNAYSRYYDLLYQDKDYAAEAAYICAMLQNNGIECGEILELGSGTGKHARLLAKQGYRVHGIERSPEMVSQAEQSQGFTCEVGDICKMSLGRTFDAVISLFHVISYQTTNTAINQVFSRAAEHLNSGGVFIFDIWYTPAVLHMKPDIRIKRLADSEVEITRIAEPKILPNANVIDVHYDIFARELISGNIQRLKEVHPMRHFSLPELDLIAGIHGFKLKNAEEFLTGNHPGETTWGVCVVLERI